MNKNLVRPARALFAVALVLALVSSTLYAIDSNNRYFAYGVRQRSCEDYVKFREKRLETLQRQHERYTKDELYEIVDKIVEHWIAGFLTAHNLYVSDTYDVAAKSTMDELKTRLEKSCRANTKQHFAEAVITLTQELHPQRAKADMKK
jgi:transcriptional regulator of NAD metabolism